MNTKDESKYIMADVAPDPQIIIWENIYTGGFKKKLRRFISLLVFLVLIFGCTIYCYKYYNSLCSYCINKNLKRYSTIFLSVNRLQ